MTRARDVSRLVTTPPNIYATDTETSSAGYLTNASASTIYSTISSNKIVQIVFAEYGTETQSTSSTLANTGLSATITPTSASNKILCIVSHTATGKESNDTWVRMTFLRGSTTIFTPIASGGRNGSTARNNFGSVTFSYLDSPATTSATTYKTMFASPNNNLGANVQVDGCPSTLTLIEVKP